MAGYDASSSWSGYQYQGKVSIYIVLKYINEFNDKYKKYSIEIENREDFAIKKNNKYQSLHQVKAKLSSNTINSYLDAMRKLNEVKINGCELYLHTANEISNWDIISYRDTIQTKIENKEKDVRNEKRLEKIDEYKKQIKEIKAMYTDDIYTNVILYEYDKAEKYCTLSNIEKLIKNEIIEYFKNRGEEHKTGNKVIEIIYHNFIGLIDEHVKNRHENGIKSTIEFNVFKSKLDDEKIFQREEEFHLFKIKDKYISRAINEYCWKFCFKQETCLKELFKCKINKFISKMETMKLKDFKIIIYKINPHIEIIDDWEYCEDLMNTQGIYFLYDILISEINRDYNIDNNSIYFKNKDYYYIPTTINSKEERRKNIYTIDYCKNIRNNDYLIEDINEIDFLITENIDEKNILGNITDVEEVDMDKREQDIKMKGKKFLTHEIGFKSIEVVRKELEI